MSTPATFGAAVVAAAVASTLPALVATGHPWMASSGLALALGTWVFLSWHAARSTVARHRDVLTYAHNSINLGVDPAPVVEALAGCRDYDADEHEDDLRHGRWIHLRPSYED